LKLNTRLEYKDNIQECLPLALLTVSKRELPYEEQGSEDANLESVSILCIIFPNPRTLATCQTVQKDDLKSQSGVSRVSSLQDASVGGDSLYGVFVWLLRGAWPQKPSSPD
jgi:hypothetical protein